MLTLHQASQIPPVIIYALKPTSQTSGGQSFLALLWKASSGKVTHKDCCVYIQACLPSSASAASQGVVRRIPEAWCVEKHEVRDWRRVCAPSAAVCRGTLANTEWIIIESKHLHFHDRVQMGTQRSLHALTPFPCNNSFVLPCFV